MCSYFTLVHKYNVRNNIILCIHGIYCVTIKKKKKTYNYNGVYILGSKRYGLSNVVPRPEGMRTHKLHSITRLTNNTGRRGKFLDCARKIDSKYKTIIGRESSVCIKKCIVVK